MQQHSARKRERQLRGALAVSNTDDADNFDCEIARLVARAERHEAATRGSDRERWTQTVHFLNVARGPVRRMMMDKARAETPY